MATKKRTVFIAALLAAIMLACGASGAVALVIPGTPEYDSREITYEVPSYDREVRVSYRSAERETVDKGREVRIVYPGRSGHARRNGSLLERARRRLRAERTVTTDYSLSRAPSAVSYRNSSYHRDGRLDATSAGVRDYPAAKTNSYEASYGTASWYGWEFHGRQTANGETYNMYDRTAAHRTLPFGTLVKVTNLRNGRQVIVRINDRGPFVRGREIDLSYATARDLGMLETGVERVRLEILPS